MGRKYQTKIGLREEFGQLASFRFSKTPIRRFITKIIHITSMMIFSPIMYFVDLIKIRLNTNIRIIHFLMSCLICVFMSKWNYLLNLFNLNQNALFLCILLLECILILFCIQIAMNIKKKKIWINFYKIPCVVRETFPEYNGYYNILKKFRKNGNWFWFEIFILFLGKIICRSILWFPIWIKFVTLVYCLDYAKYTVYYGLCLDSILILFIFSAFIWNERENKIIYFIEFLQDAFIVISSYIIFKYHIKRKEDLLINTRNWNKATKLRKVLEFF